MTPPPLHFTDHHVACTSKMLYAVTVVAPSHLPVQLPNFHSYAVKQYE